jgi:methionyl-tRNA formyltransferase
VRLVFAGTPPFAATALEALAAAGHEIPLVLTQPDRPAGRGMRLAASAVARTAEGLGLEVAKPPGLRTQEAADLLRSVRPDVMVVAAYGLILPQAILDLPARGCLNIHASLLPRWRGAAPVQRAILAGDTETGVCIMRMEAGLDTGPVLLAKHLAIAPRVTSGELTESLARLGAAAIVETLAALDHLQARPQPVEGVTYAAKVTKPEARIEWSRPAVEIDRQVRAFNPAPGAETSLHGQTLKIWAAEAESRSGAPGTILESGAGGIVVGCGTGSLKVRELQRAGSRRMAADEFIRGMALAPGMLLEAATT